MGMGFAMGYGLFQFLFVIVFVVVIGTFVVVAVRGIGQWSKNNQSPRLTVEATVVTKRADVSVHHHGNAGDASGGYHTSSSTSYYATFQVESGDRMELPIPGNEYGLLVEGDKGKLTFQGTRYLGFERT